MLFLIFIIFQFIIINIFFYRPSGKTFEVAADDVLISTPSMGDIISFSFESNSRRELPVNPKIFRVRDDLSWSDVVSNFQKDRQYLNGMNNKKTNINIEY